jgi:hypothetical protein
VRVFAQRLVGRRLALELAAGSWIDHARDRSNEFFRCTAAGTRGRAGSSDRRALAWILERSSSQRWGYKAQLQANLSEMMARESKRILNVVEKHAGPDVASKILADLIDEESGEGTAGGTAEPGPAGAGAGALNKRGVH